MEDEYGWKDYKRQEDVQSDEYGRNYYFMKEETEFDHHEHLTVNPYEDDPHGRRRGRPRDPSDIRDMKKGIHRKIGIANKRIDRLSEQGLEDTPAMRNLRDVAGINRFSIKGYKGKNELRRLEGHLDKFIGRKTSTVTGVKNWQKGIADSLGVNYEKVSEIGNHLDKYLELLNKLTEYQKSQGGVEEGSERRVTAIDKYIKENEIDMTKIDPDDLVELVDDMMNEEEDTYLRMLAEMESGWWFSEDGEDWEDGD